MLTIGNSTTPNLKMTKETATFIVRLAEKDSKRKKKKDAKKPKDGVVRRIAKNGLVDKDKVKAAKTSPSKKKKKKKKGSSSSSSSYKSCSDSSFSSIDSFSDLDDSSSDGKKNKSKKRKSQKDDSDDKSSAKAKSRVRKENKIQILKQTMEESQKGILDIATELLELRGLPEVIQKQFSEQQAKRNGNDKEKAEPLMTMLQWKALLENNKASPIPPTPAKAGLFTAACGKAKATPRQMLPLALPATAASMNTTQSASMTHTEVTGGRSQIKLDNCRQLQEVTPLQGLH